MKKIKITLKDADKLEFVLEEKGEKGDYISLSDFNEVNFILLKEKIDEEKESILIHLWNQKKHDIILNSKEFKDLHEDILTLNNKSIDLSSELEKVKLEKDNDIKGAKLELQRESTSTISKLESEKKSLEENQEKEIKFAVSESEKVKDIKINELSFELAKLKSEKNNDIEAAKLELERKSTSTISKLESEKKSLEANQEKEIKFAVSELEKDKNNKIAELEKNIERLERSKNSLNIKRLGEDLENYIFLTFEEYMGSYEDIKFYKTNTSIDGTKPDFQFEVYANGDKNKEDKLISVTIEAKTEEENTEKRNRKTNSSHFSKLDKDRENYKGDYSLLITELEREENFTIKSMGNTEYKNMFVSRPSEFIPFLVMVYKIAQKQKEVIKKTIDFQNRQVILDEFNEFKNNLLNNSIKNFDNNIKKITKESDTIIAAANRQLDTSKILGTHVVAIQNKLNNFNIEKTILSKILIEEEKIDQK